METRSLRDRFSSASLSSVRTLLPQYTAVDILGEPAVTASAVNEDIHGPPAYRPETNTIPTRPLRNRFSIASLSSIRTLLPQYTVVGVLGEPAAGTTSVNVSPPYGPSSPNIRTSASTPLQGAPPRYPMPLNPPRELTLTWRASTATPLEVPTPEFRYSYPIRPKKSWATLLLQTRDAVPGNPRPLQSQPRVPRFWSCDPMTGTLELDLDGPQNIQQINVSLKGNLILSSVSEVEFLGHEVTLWDKSMGDPRQSDANSTPKNGLASGKYTFPFSFPFPTHTSLDISSISPFPPLASPDPTFAPHEHIPKDEEKRKNMPLTSCFIASSVLPPGKAETEQIQTCSRPPTSAMMLGRAHRGLAPPLPQSFMEKGIDPSVSYEISVRIDHGRFRASSRIRTDIVYTPALQPLPVPQKTREAYEAGAFLPHPMDNPEGWFALPMVTLYGVVNPDANPRHTKADCNLFLAQPLSYTRGSVIPCFLTISSDDQEVVRVLSSPKTATVRLLRRIQYLTTILNGELKLVHHEVGRAQWWISLKDIAQGPNVRHLEGEIHLNPKLQPCCDFQFFQVEYVVDLLPFQTADFETEIHPSLGKLRKKDVALASNPVEITTLYRRDEPIPTAYSEPPKINSQDKGTKESSKRLDLGMQLSPSLTLR